ncbi:MAG: (2Fe-2S)-binding protein [Acidimicrobiales bacterium]
MTTFELDGSPVEVVDDSVSLLDALREELGVRAVKDGCSPQGQCGCCTVLVDGAPRVSCVTPVRRVAGRSVVTTAGLDPAVRDRWAGAFVATGASQCGFCTPGILLRLAALAERRPGATDDDVRTALLAHLCRCTGWQTVVEAARSVLDAPAAGSPVPLPAAAPGPARDPLLAAWRAQLEGPAFQAVGPEVVLGGGGFADDRSPAGALVAMPLAAVGGPAGEPEDLVVAPTLPAARAASGRVQGRRSTVPLTHPVPLADGEWALTLRTTWVEPAYLEPDASWCDPGGRPATPLANGGAFGGKRHSPVPGLARALADRHDEAVRVLWSREDVTRRGPKRPPVAAGMRADGSGVLRVATTSGSSPLDGLAERVAAAAPGLSVEEVAVPGPPVSLDLRGAGWAEAAVLSAVLAATAAGGAGPGTPAVVTGRHGGRAVARVSADGPVEVEVWAGTVLDAVTLRSYCIGAAHQALGWVRHEGVSVDEGGMVQDLTIRSYGVLSARDTPRIEVTLHDEDTWPVNGSDAVFAAVAAAAWLADGLAPAWPTRRGSRGEG